MGCRMSPLILLVYSVLLLQCLCQITRAGQLKYFQEAEHGDRKMNHTSSSSSHDIEEPELNVFFHYKDLRVGNKMRIYFPTKEPSTSPHLLSREESDSIPFSSSQLGHILELFSFPEGSKQAKAMRETLEHCESPPLKGETKFCTSSLESMLDSVGQVFGSKSKLRVVTTNHHSESIPPVQKYTISDEPPPRVIEAGKVVACHMLPYPYAVFYCHSQDRDKELYKVWLVGEDGGRVEAAAMCHMDTSQWDPHHIAFRVLKTLSGPVCHFFPSDNLIWLPTSV